MGARLNGVSGPVEARREKDSQERKPRGRGRGGQGPRRQKSAEAGPPLVRGPWQVPGRLGTGGSRHLGDGREKFWSQLEGKVFLKGGGPTGARS